MKHKNARKTLFETHNSESKRKVSRATPDKIPVRRSPRTSTGISPADRNYPVHFLSKANQSSILKYVSKSSDKRKSHNKSTTEINKENISSPKSVALTKNSIVSKTKKGSFEAAKQRKPLDIKKHERGRKVSRKTENKSQAEVKNPMSSKTRTSPTITKRNQTNNETSKTKTTNSRKRKMKVYDISPEMKKAKYYEDDVRKWKSLDKTTLSFVMTLVNAGIDGLLNKPMGDDFSAVQECLNSFHNQLTRKFRTLKTPACSFKDYRKLHRLTAGYKEEVERYEDQEVVLFDAVEQEERYCENLKEEIEREAQEQENLAAMVDDSELHPLLKAYEDYKPVLATAADVNKTHYDD